MDGFMVTLEILLRIHIDKRRIRIRPIWKQEGPAEVSKKAYKDPSIHF